ncbi:MAG: carboxypeptidase-like regulatory domain-containing protein [Lachnospiraceae bacterium]|nr:carboxypeptidase-like regulatory domain-containing protein [Lachnospiraceae bacterium]
MDNKKSNPVISVIIALIVFIAIASGAYFLVRTVFTRQETKAQELAAWEYEKEKKEALAQGETVKKETSEVTAAPSDKSEKTVQETTSSQSASDKKASDEKASAQGETSSGNKTASLEKTSSGDTPAETGESVDVSKFLSRSKRVDYTVEYFKPGKRNGSLTWEDRVFAKIENLESPKDAPINTFPISRRKLKSQDDKDIEYEVYSYPDTQKPAKLSYIEDCGDYYEITDYYFDKEGKLNYASVYDQIVILPVELNSSSVKSRYYITDDTLVRYIYTEGDVSTSYKASDISKYSSGTKEQYDYLEKSIVNGAYISYYAYLNTKESITIQGYVQDEFDMPLVGVKVTLSGGKKDKRTNTDGDGHYSFTVEPSDNPYKLSMEKDSLSGESIYNIKLPSGSGDYYADTVYMGYQNNQSAAYDVHLIVRDAISNSKIIDEADIKLRRGVNNLDGEIFASGKLDSAGSINLPLSSGMYTAGVDKEGYETSYFNIIVKQNHQSAMGYAVPEIEEGKYLAFVYWEATPYDLDCRMIGEYGRTILRSPVDSIGSVMTECFALENIGNEPYKLYVSDYISCTSGNTMSYSMSGSGAYAKVYSSDGLQASINVPAAHAGVIWDALTLRNGVIYPDNRYYYNISSDLYWTSK